MANVDWKKWGPLLVVLFFNYLLWGSSASFAKIALSEFHPIFLVGARLLIATLVFTPIIIWKFRPIRVRKKDIPLLALLILCDPTGFFMFEALGISYTSASQASMMWAIGPLLNLVLASLILRERTNFRTICAFVVAMLGVALLTVGAEESEHASNPLLGNFLMFLSLCCAGGFMIIIRFLGGRYPATLLVWLQCTGATIIFIPIVLLTPESHPTHFETIPTLAMLYLAVGITFGAQFCSAYALAHLTVTRMSALGNIIPVVGVMFGIFMLGETLEPLQWVACAIVLGAVIVSQYFQNRFQQQQAKAAAAAAGAGRDIVVEPKDKSAG